MKWWLSFCDPDRTPGDQFVGVCIVEIPEPDSLQQAVRTAHALRCNPGGEIAAVRLSKDAEIPAKWLGRLLSKEDCEQFNREMNASCMN